MKKLLLVFLVASSVICCFAQSWSSSTGILYTNPTTTKIGIGLNNPSQNLQVLGGVKIGNSSNSTDRSKSILYFGDGSYVQIGEWDADDVLSFKANSYRFQDISESMLFQFTNWM